MIGEKWMKWTLLESGTRVTSRILQKVIGFVSTAFACNVLASFVVGLIQTVASFIVLKVQHKGIRPDRKGLIGSCLFGTFATFSTIVPFTIYYLGGDIGVVAFIIALSIVPGAFVDWLFFSHPLNKRQWFGVVVSLFGAYALLGLPSVAGLMAMPLWVWLAFAVMLANTTNQAITQKIKDVDAFVKNFWGGLMNVILSLGVLIVIGATSFLTDFSHNMRKLWLVSSIGGVVVIAMWSFNLFSYKDGASIAIKKLVMQGTLLIGSMIAGIVFFHEALTWGKVLGATLYFVAFALMDNGTWNYIAGRFRSEPTKPPSDVPVKVPTRV